MTDDDEQSRREHSQQSGSTLNENEIGSSDEPKPLSRAGALSTKTRSAAQMSRSPLWPRGGLVLPD